jgi:hypothetical protein
VDGVDAKLAFGDLNTHERFFSLVQLRQCSITSLDLVDIGSPQRGLPDVDLGVRESQSRLDAGTRTSSPIRTFEPTRRESANSRPSAPTQTSFDSSGLISRTREGNCASALAGAATIVSTTEFMAA